MQLAHGKGVKVADDVGNGRPSRPVADNGAVLLVLQIVGLARLPVLPAHYPVRLGPPPDPVLVEVLKPDEKRLPSVPFSVLVAQHVHEVVIDQVHFGRIPKKKKKWKIKLTMWHRNSYFIDRFDHFKMMHFLRMRSLSFYLSIITQWFRVMGTPTRHMDIHIYIYIYIQYDEIFPSLMLMLF